MGKANLLARNKLFNLVAAGIANSHPAPFYTGRSKTFKSNRRHELKRSARRKARGRC